MGCPELGHALLPVWFIKIINPPIAGSGATMNSSIQFDIITQARLCVFIYLFCASFAFRGVSRGQKDTFFPTQNRHIQPFWTEGQYSRVSCPRLILPGARRTLATLFSSSSTTPSFSTFPSQYQLFLISTILKMNHPESLHQVTVPLLLPP